MNVRTVCLSILYEGDATGYQIRRLCTEGECSFFVEASFGSIYPALAKLEDDGLVTSKIEAQDGRPSKKVYSITEAGRSAFVDSLYEPVEEDIFRSPFLLFVRYADLMPADLVEQRLNEYFDRIARKKTMLEEARREHGTRATDAWVIDHGLHTMELVLQHLRDHMHELIALAKPVASKKHAAE